MFSRIFCYERKKTVLVQSAIVIVFIIIMSVQNVYAVNSPYEEKMETSINLEYITSHLISILYSISNEDYEFAQLKLAHPPIEYDELLKTINTDECNELYRTLNVLQHISPDRYTDGINEIFSHAFEKLNECKHNIVEESLSKNLYYNADIIIALLEKSQDEYVLSDSLYGDDKVVRIQESLSLVIRAHMLVTTHVFNDVAVIEKNFMKLFLEYNVNSTSEEIISLSNMIIDDINYALVSEGLEGFGVTLNQKQELSEPEIFLNAKYYSDNYALVELSGKNFDGEEHVTIKFISPHSEYLQKLVVITSFSGNFNIPLEFVNINSEESYFFSIDTGKNTSYKFLKILDT